jgi:hypothetical protein
MACFRPSCASETTSREERRPERTILRRPDIDAQHLAFACGRRTGTTWQRCRVHFMRNLLATVPQGAREPIAAVVRTIFAQPDHATALTQLRKVAEGLRARFARTSTLLKEAAEDILAYRHLPLEHQRQLHSTDAIDEHFLRLNTARRRCTRRGRLTGLRTPASGTLRVLALFPLQRRALTITKSLDAVGGREPFLPAL